MVFRAAHLLSVTPSGKRLRESVQRDIQRREERLLSRLPAGDRAAFPRALQTLSDLSPALARQGEDLGVPHGLLQNRLARRAVAPGS